MSSASSNWLLLSLCKGIWNDPLIIRFCLGSLLVQAVLTFLFKFVLPWDGPWKSTALFTGKQVIVIGMMIFQTYWGFQFWSSETYDFAKNPPFSSVEQDATSSDWSGGLWMSRLVLGGLLYDIPIGSMTGAVDVMMHLHHLGMFTVGTITLGYWSDPPVPINTRYTPFFFGVIELSSIPLALVDVFHPKKQPEWYAWSQQYPAIQQVNEICRISFALLYIVLRVIYFPQVIAKQVVPDCWAKLQEEANAEYKLVCAVSMAFAILFTLLQLYWGTLILRQISKALKGGGDEEEKTTTEGTKGKVKAKIKAV